MALQEVTSAFLRRLRLSERPIRLSTNTQCRRYASNEVQKSQGTTSLDQNLEETSFTGASSSSPSDVSAFDPARRARERTTRLPASRYKFRPPKYYRGPLHPHQPPKPSDPASREFIPGPFSLPRLHQTYDSTLAPDLMTLAYTHFPPGFERAQKGERLRSWSTQAAGESPYYKNRPLRGPRGGDVLRLLRKPITFRNIPQLTRVTVHSMVKQAKSDSAHLHIAGMVMQAITNVRVTAHRTRKSVAGFEVRAGQYLSVTAELTGEDMYHFLSKVVDVVMPKIKDWRGVKGSSGDTSGNLAFGLTGDEVALFPEVEVNYDMYVSDHFLCFAKAHRS